jgi:hypothetical protein
METAAVPNAMRAMCLMARAMVLSFYELDSIGVLETRNVLESPEAQADARARVPCRARIFYLDGRLDFLKES